MGTVKSNAKARRLGRAGRAGEEGGGQQAQSPSQSPHVIDYQAMSVAQKTETENDELVGAGVGTGFTDTAAS